MTARQHWRRALPAVAASLMSISALPVAALAAPPGASTMSVFEWADDVDGVWTDPTAWRWLSGPVDAGFPDGSNDTARFATSGIAARTIVVPAGREIAIGTLRFATPQLYTIASGGAGALLELGGQVTVSGSAAGTTIVVPVELASSTVLTVDAPATLTIAAPVTQRGPASLTLAGDGEVALSSVNDFSGGVMVNAGTLVVGADQALGSGTLTLEADTTIRAAGARTLVNPVDISGSNGKSTTFTGGDITFTSATSVVSKNTKLQVDNATWFTALGDGQNGNRSLRVTGSGTLTIDAAGPRNVGWAGGNLSALAGGGLDITGTGTIGAPSWASTARGRLSIAGRGVTGRLTAVGDVALGAQTTFEADLNDPRPGNGHDQLRVLPGGAAGNVTLGGATLAAAVDPATAVGESFTVVHADGAVLGRFAGAIASGCTVNSAGVLLRVDYQPSTVILTRVGTPANQALTLTGFPSPRAAGQPGTFTVAVTDCAGAPLPGYTGGVTFSSSDPAAVLPAPYTFVAADAGRHTFSATFATPGTHTLTGTDTTTGQLAVQADIVVTPSEADLALAVTPASAAVAVGTPFTVRVTVTNNGPAVADGVTLSITPSSGLSINPAGGPWSAGSIPVGSSAALELTVTATAEGAHTLTAARTAQSTVDPNSSNDTAGVTIAATALPTTPPTAPDPSAPPAPRSASETPPPTQPAAPASTSQPPTGTPAPSTSPAPVAASTATTPLAASTATTPRALPSATPEATPATPETPETPEETDFGTAAADPAIASSEPEPVLPQTPSAVSAQPSGVSAQSSAALPADRRQLVSATAAPESASPTSEPLTTAPSQVPTTAAVSADPPPTPAPTASGVPSAEQASAAQQGSPNRSASAIGVRERPPSHKRGITESSAASATRRVQQAAVAVAEGGAFPGVLLLLVVAFLAAQNRIDRRDPKLLLSPLTAEPYLEYR